MQILSLSQNLLPQLAEFLSLQRKFDSEHFFAPHPYDAVSLDKLLSTIRRDVYLLAMHHDIVLAYGMLRGWDEGFLIPSLGVAVSPNYQGVGLGRAMMELLHCTAKVHGSAKVRLRVNATNQKAINLYRSLGYEFSKDASMPGYLIGQVNLKVKL
jgi:[ribosomal protein S18]-alanine N-acetyltransferase